MVLDESGFSKGFGFIRFNNEVEQQTAMTSMNGMSGLGGKPIKVSVAVNKIKDGGMNGGGGHGNVPDHIYKQVTNNVVGKFWTAFVAKTSLYFDESRRRLWQQEWWAKLMGQPWWAWTASLWVCRVLAAVSAVSATVSTVAGVWSILY